MENSKFADTLKDSMYWYLNNRKPFIINDEYQLDLLYLDFKNMCAKIRVTNIKDRSFIEKEIDSNE